MSRPVNDATLKLVETFEGFRSKPYLCSAGVPTIGIGSTVYPDGKKVTLKDKEITLVQAYEYLKAHMGKDIPKVEALVKVPLNDNQFGALVSFVYNLGAGALGSSTLLKKLNAKDYSGAAEEFLKWDFAGGKRLAGLTRRRQAERALFLHPV